MAFNFKDLVTDRSAEDVRHWERLRNKGFANMTEEERKEWQGRKMKGAYNSGDLNRVGEGLNYLHDKLKEAGYITYQNTFTAKTNWNVTSMPTADDLTHYLKCVSNVREAMAQFKSTPYAPQNSRGALNFVEANAIEKILLDVETLINNMLAARHYSGDVFAGEI